MLVIILEVKKGYNGVIDSLVFRIISVIKTIYSLIQTVLDNFQAKRVLDNQGYTVLHCKIEG